MRSPTRGCAVLVILLATGMCPSRVRAQDQSAWHGENDWKPEKEGKPAHKLDLFYKASDWYLRAGTMLDAETTFQLLNRPTIARREDRTFLMRYPSVEKGWARCLGNRNTSAVIGANVALNVGIGMLSRRIYRKGGRWRWLALGLNVLRCTQSFGAGIGNIEYGNSINGQVRQATGYSGRIIWSRH